MASQLRLKFWARKLYRRSRQVVGSRLFINPDRDVRKSILVAGTARSGTTWLADLVAAQIPCRTMFEPFNPDHVSAYRGFQYFQYMRPGAADERFLNYAGRVFSGTIRSRWIDRQNEQLFPTHRLIKEIRANLSLKWLHDHFPEVPILFIIRHPCAVVLSRMELQWATDRDLESFLKQSDLVSDYLCDHLDWIKSLQTDEEKHAVIWSISNLLPLRQFSPGEMQVVYYEDLCTRPEVELKEIFKVIHQTYRPLKAAIYDRPSQTARAASAVSAGTDRVAQWRAKLDAPQVKRILRVVQAFSLDHLYGDALFPVHAWPAKDG